MKNYYYNFKNPIRHYINIDNLHYPQDIETFDITELSWTHPIPFRQTKNITTYRTLKLPNILSFVRSYHYYKELPDFENINRLDKEHKRLKANIITGDFAVGEYDKQLNNDFENLCIYDILIKLDINEFYSRIYTHYLDLEDSSLKDNVFSGMNLGRTSGLIMGNYISLYFAEYLTSKISTELIDAFKKHNIICHFNYFSDDFYIFCNLIDQETVIKLFEESLEKYDFTRKNSIKIYNYESYNSYNIITRYWKSIQRHCNTENIKDDTLNKNTSKIHKHRLVFLNQLVYRVGKIDDEKCKRILINNYFKSKWFQTLDTSDYTVKPYNYHQLCFLLKKSPESLLYTSNLFNDMSEFDNTKMREFLISRYRVTLKRYAHDEQLYYYYAIKTYGFQGDLHEFNSLVLESKNQILISYYLKDNLFVQPEIDILKQYNTEEYWLQNYHLILYTQQNTDYESLVTRYLVPKHAKNTKKTKRYLDFYLDNLNKSKVIINDIVDINKDIDGYLTSRYEEVLSVEYDTSTDS